MARGKSASNDQAKGIDSGQALKTSRPGALIAGWTGILARAPRGSSRLAIPSSRHINDRTRSHPPSPSPERCLAFCLPLSDATRLDRFDLAHARGTLLSDRGASQASSGSACRGESTILGSNMTRSFIGILCGVFQE